MHNATISHDPPCFAQVMWSLLLGEMGEYRYRVDHREFAVTRRKWCNSRSGARVETVIEYIVVHEGELRSAGRQVVCAPVDHPGVKIDTQVALRLFALLNQLSCNAPAPASKVKHTSIQGGIKVGEGERARRVIECCYIRRSDKCSHFGRWHRQDLMLGKMLVAG